MLLYSARGQQLRNWSGYNWIWSGARDQESTNHSAGFVEWKSRYITTCFITGLEVTYKLFLMSQRKGVHEFMKLAYYDYMNIWLIPLMLKPNGPRFRRSMFFQPIRFRIFTFPLRRRNLRRRPLNIARGLSQQIRTDRHVPLRRIWRAPSLEGTYLHCPLTRIPNCFPLSMTRLNLPRYSMFQPPRLLWTFLYLPLYLSRISGYFLFRLRPIHFLPNLIFGRPRRKLIGLPFPFIFTFSSPRLGYIQRSFRRVTTFRRRMIRLTGRHGLFPGRILTLPPRILQNKKEIQT